MVRKREATITKKELLDKIGDYSIFEKYISFKEGKKFSSPFRSDSDPSCLIKQSKNGKFYFCDYGAKESLDCISFVMKLYNLDFVDCLKKIAFDFNLIDKLGVKNADVPITRKYSFTKKNKAESIISIGYRNFTENDMKYWGQYGITEEELKKNHVYSVNTAYKNGVPIPPANDDLRFGYLIKSSTKDYIKIYSPNDQKEYKWVSSCPNNIPFGFFDLKKKGGKLVISKSAKDMILLRRIFDNVIGVQSEDITSLTDKTKEWINKHYNDVLVFFDNDEQGIKSLGQYQKQLGWKTFHFPEFYLEEHGVKDPADFVKKWGIDTLKLYLKQNNLL